jgi:hypothetical protein
MPMNLAMDVMENTVDSEPTAPTHRSFLLTREPFRLWHFLPRFLLIIFALPGLLVGVVLVDMATNGHPKPLDMRAKSAVSIAGTLAQFVRNGGDSFEPATPTNLARQEPPGDLVFIGASDVSKKPRTVSVLSTKTTFTAAAHSETGACFFIRESDDPGRQRAKVPNGRCSADNAPDATSPLWEPGR